MSKDKLSPEQDQLISNMESLGDITDGEFFLICDTETLDKFTKKYPNEFEEAKKITMPTAKQIKFAEHLMEQGAPHENSLYNSMHNADKYIKKHQYLKKSFYMTTLRADEWGGILNC